jgi:hypothetical protein
VALIEASKTPHDAFVVFGEIFASSQPMSKMALQKERSRFSIGENEEIQDGILRLQALINKMDAVDLKRSEDDKYYTLLTALSSKMSTWVDMMEANVHRITFDAL